MTSTILKGTLYPERYLISNGKPHLMPQILCSIAMQLFHPRTGFTNPQYRRHQTAFLLIKRAVQLAAGRPVK